MADVFDSASRNVHPAQIDRRALDTALFAQGAEFQKAMSDGHRHLFSDAAVCVSAAQVAQMQAVIAAVEASLLANSALPHPNPLPLGEGTSVAVPAQKNCLGVFYGYDFHLNSDGAHLIEINTNAGGAYLNAVLIDSQRETGLQGVWPVHASTDSARTEIDLGREFIAMFRNEWRLARGNEPLNTIAIVDETPTEQYLYPEFLLARNMFERAGIAAHIVAPDGLQARDDGLYAQEQKIDLIYNRLTDFSLQQFPHLLAAYENQRAVFTPNPAHYQRYADKRKLVALGDANRLQTAGVTQANIDLLLRGIPPTRSVRAEDAETWWAERKQWFFKPVNGYGSKGAYRGDKLTRRVFEEVMQSEYVAQRLAMPGECVVRTENGEAQSLKYDVRCYVYDGHIQLIAARLYQGQTTNFRTPGGGFAVVRVVG